MRNLRRTRFLLGNLRHLNGHRVSRWKVSRDRTHRHLLKGKSIFDLPLSSRQTEEFRFTLKNDSVCLLIWRKQCTRYNPSSKVEGYSYRGGGIMVWSEISLGGHTVLHVIYGGILTGVRYRGEILD
ncbi:transposable element Tcb2 transposase [Trichonephila clavipes]|nr:transposable element Tcb2 transposase [Trichonephila clavipes]